MTPHRLDICRERPENSTGLFILDDARACLPGLIERFGGQVQAVYLDPPFATGRSFDMKSPGQVSLRAYDDPADREELTSLLREVIKGARELMRDDGLMFLHVDWRMSGRARMLLDEIFGEENIVNEIIWSYQTGGRSYKYFSRKHDTIFMYRKGEKYYFNAGAVAVKRDGARSNHMKRGTDADGRTYSEIRSAGRLYRYYDDEPVLPGDVWNDLQMQQKDPQRTGFETQKPLALMERIILCSTRPGDTVADLMSGSGTTAAAATALERRFIASDRSPAALVSLRRRITHPFEAVTPVSDMPDIDIDIKPVGLGDCLVTFNGFTDGDESRLDGWAAGYIQNGAFVPFASAQRPVRGGNIAEHLTIPMLDDTPAFRISDIYGNTAFYSAD